MSNYTTSNPLVELLNEGGGTVDTIAKVLSQNPHLINKPFSTETDNICEADEGSTPLMWAIDGVHCGHMRGTPDSAFRKTMPLITYLLSHGADPTIVNQKGVGALDLMESWPEKYAHILA